MTTTRPSNSQTIGISISDSPDLAAFGLSHGHLSDAMVNIATHLLAAGDSLAYGGDLRPGGYTPTLLELVHRYTPDTVNVSQRAPLEVQGTQMQRVANYLAWPVHIGMDSTTLEN